MFIPTLTRRTLRTAEEFTSKMPWLVRRFAMKLPNHHPLWKVYPRIQQSLRDTSRRLATARAVLSDPIWLVAVWHDEGRIEGIEFLPLGWDYDLQKPVYSDMGWRRSNAEGRIHFDDGGGCMVWQMPEDGLVWAEDNCYSVVFRSCLDAIRFARQVRLVQRGQSIDEETLARVFLLSA